MLKYADTFPGLLRKSLIAERGFSFQRREQKFVKIERHSDFNYPVKYNRTVASQSWPDLVMESLAVNIRTLQ